MTKYLVDGTILGQRSLSPDIRVMEIKAPEIAKTAEPGQFVTIKTNHLSVPLLRRPFGVAGVDREKGSFLLIYRVVGETTHLMETLKEGDSISILGPLGHGFDRTHKNALLIGGGVGLAPLHFLAADYPGAQVDVLIGARTAKELFWTELFRDKTRRQIETTDDGTWGIKGMVTTPLPELLKEGQYDCVYVCGPSPMMRAVVDIVRPTGIPCQISLEKYMGCGLGACLSCTCSGIGRRVKVCKDGPVFWAGEVTAW
jgi:dihydroorotate dehydrogenase electron transfer subunit